MHESFAAILPAMSWLDEADGYNATMTHTPDDKQYPTYETLTLIVEALDRRFPNDNEIYQRLGRLTEEVGELAKVINHHEGTGIKAQKYGAPDREQLVHELQDVLRATLGIARHYDAEEELAASIHAYYEWCKAEGYIAQK